MKVLAVRWAGAPTRCFSPLNYSALLQALLCCAPHYLPSLISPLVRATLLGMCGDFWLHVCNMARGVTLADPKDKQSNFSALPSLKMQVTHPAEKNMVAGPPESHVWNSRET